jgi:hypothetical protein
VRAINERHGVVDIAFLAEFNNEHVGDTLVRRRLKRCMQEFVGFGIDSSVRSILLVIELDHSFVNCDVIRPQTRFRL